MPNEQPPVLLAQWSRLEAVVNQTVAKPARHVIHGPILSPMRRTPSAGVVPMSAPIGILLPARLTCADAHLPATYNPWADKTWCLCGKVTWPGERCAWKSVSRYQWDGVKYVVTGWDTYQLHLKNCECERGT